MYKNRISLKDKRVVIPVFVLLSTVAISNLRTFLPDLWRESAGAAVTEQELPVPDDLADLTRAAAAHISGLGPSDALVGAAGDTSGARKDPFSAPVVHTPPPPSRSTDQRRAPRRRLFCNAVLLGGERPAAMINGRTYYPGNLVGSYRIETIEANRVVLVSSAGHLVLKVDGPADSRQEAGSVNPNDSSSSGRKEP